MSEKKATKGSHDFVSYFKRAASPMLVLTLLQHESMYVYQITQELKMRSNGKYDLALLYPVLYKLQKMGYVCESRKEISEDNRVRNYYVITESGRNYLQQLKQEYHEMSDAVRDILAWNENG